MRYFHLLRLIFIFLGFLKRENTYWGYFVIVKAALSKCKAKLHYRTLQDRNHAKFFMEELTQCGTVNEIHKYRTEKTETKQWHKDRMLNWITDMEAWETRPVAPDEPPPSTLPGQFPCHGKATIGQPPPPVENPDEATKDQQHDWSSYSQRPPPKDLQPFPEPPYRTWGTWQQTAEHRNWAKRGWRNWEEDDKWNSTNGSWCD